MSSLTDIEKRYLERILGMGSGYVLDYSDATYAEFFARHNIEIHSSRYQRYGTSKAKKMRAFWEVESDEIVAPVLSEMLASYEADCELEGKEVDKGILDKAKEIVSRIGGVHSYTASKDPEDAFLSLEFEIPNLHKLPIEHQVIDVVEARLNEARRALRVGAYLSVIFMCGSVLEGVLLGVAHRNPEKFNRASVCPRTVDGKVKQFHDWKLSQLIDAACDINFLKPDVKTFSHGLRDFRNYIHPYQQLVSGFSPDEHTAKVCFQVLKAALASLAGERK